MYAVKIIRNKKRFHHQALVELKVLKYLVEEDPDDSYNVVHMQVRERMSEKLLDRHRNTSPSATTSALP